MMPVGGYGRGKAVSFVCEVFRCWGVRWVRVTFKNDLFLNFGFWLRIIITVRCHKLWFELILGVALHRCLELCGVFIC